jgi:hypothetical protein
MNLATKMAALESANEADAKDILSVQAFSHFGYKLYKA